MSVHYESWLASSSIDEAMKQELREMTKEQIEDAFFQDLAFGTGGMRGVLGAGTNRLNVATVRRAAHGIANYISSQGEEAKRRGFVIAFDNRRMSKEFSQEVASVLGSNGIQVYLYEQPRTTPQLSFSIRQLNCFMGMMITASHNPPEYNGLKVYGEDGAQLNLEDAERVVAAIQQVAAPETISSLSFSESLRDASIQYVGQTLDEAYQQQVASVVFDLESLQKTTLKTIFTPLHGASGSTVRALQDKLAIPHFSFVEAQMEPDSEFSTLTSANPEDESAFALAIEQGIAQQTDLLIAVDPDGDRVGLAVWTGSSYQLLNGNETGALVLHFILSQHQQQGTLPTNGIVYKTIVTSEMGRMIAKSFGVTTEDVLTGFKFIGEKIREIEHDSSYKFLFGYEESYGYLAKPFARDKDAIQLVVLLTEMAAYYHAQSMTLVEALDALYETYGVFKEKLISVTIKGMSGAAQIQQALQSVRKEQLTQMADSQVIHFEDYLSQVRKSQEEQEQLTLPSADVLKFVLSDGTWVCLRPSGTEPKIKYYIGVQKNTATEAQTRLNEVGEWVNGWMELKLKL